ncbi:MAG: polynucleotide adenylyltransferase PcnB [Parachlamydiales bacterium]|nr:polynucleotide adenylyltransferase PcnB [Parachlamydiales bacterium]
MTEFKEYTYEQHKIPIKKIDQHAFYVIEKLKQLRYEAYLVGGGVRDLLLNTRPKDFDIATSATPIEIKKAFKNTLLIGRRFRLAHVRFGKKILEVSTFRSGESNSQSLIIRDNIWGNAAEDVLRRDFTINGLFYDPEKQTLIDYVGGYEDAQKKILRAIGDPITRFLQDPVRMIRLLKFRARFHFEIEQKTHDALLSSIHEITKSSPSRIFEEILRMLESGAAHSFFHLLYEYKFIDILLPHIAQFMNSDPTNKIYQYLEQADILTSKNPLPKPDRAILLSCLAFPILEDLLSNKKHIPHLGIIAQEAYTFIKELFSPFFQISKKLKSMMTSIITHQYRLNTLPKKFHIPQDPCFPYAMQFFHIRCMINTHLYDHYIKWNEHIIENHQKKKKS